MRLAFGGIEADSHEAAAAIARDKPTDQAHSIDDECDGENLAALVDVAGDEEHAQSRMIDFEPERQYKAATGLLSTLKAVAELRRKWRSQDEDETIDSLEYMDGLDALELDAVIAEAESADILPRPTVATLRAALKSILPYAWNERASLREIWERRDGNPNAKKDLAACDRALDQAEAAIAGAEAALPPSSPTPAEKEMYDTLRYVAEMLSGFKHYESTCERSSGVSSVMRVKLAKWDSSCGSRKMVRRCRREPDWVGGFGPLSPECPGVCYWGILHL
jgi:hypothetical protein